MRTIILWTIVIIITACSFEESPEVTLTPFPYPLISTVSRNPSITPSPIISLPPTYTTIPTITRAITATVREELSSHDKDPSITREPGTPTSTWVPAGDGYIVEEEMYATSTICNNAWIYPVGDRQTVLWACGSGDKYDEGMIIVFSETGDVHTIYTPTNTGYVRVIDAKDEKVVLESRRGFIYIFDLSLMEFVNSLAD